MIKIREQIIPIYDAAYKILQKDISIKHIQAKDEQLKEMCPDKERTGIEYKEYIHIKIMYKIKRGNSNNRERKIFQR